MIIAIIRSKNHFFEVQFSTSSEKHFSSHFESLIFGQFSTENWLFLKIGHFLKVDTITIG